MHLVHLKRFMIVTCDLLTNILPPSITQSAVISKIVSGINEFDTSAVFLAAEAALLKVWFGNSGL